MYAFCRSPRDRGDMPVYQAEEEIARRLLCTGKPVISGGEGRTVRTFRIGAHHGISTVGNSWAMMLLMFAFGLESITWMAVLLAVMAVEKEGRWGRRLALPIGGVLLGSATFLSLISLDLA